MPKYTVFCQETSGRGTIWIASVDADSPEQAQDFGRAECAADWGFDVEHVHVLGVAAGDVEVLFWEDLNDD